tara:strand:- start:36360 stop:37754 length:1395 start_codon:yes stop_codon:yes gene_type:complete
MNKKIFIFLPDGVGLRNFSFTNFYELGKKKGYDITYWNNTIFPLQEKFKYNEKVINYSKSNPLTDIFKRSRTKIELQQNHKKFKNSAYLAYIFPQSYKTLKTTVKNILVNLFSRVYNSNKGLILIRKKINWIERKTNYYKRVKQQLEIEQPDFVFCTNQRPLFGISPMLAAKDLGIPTATFIFSWDNLPKGTLVVETDYYFVWSNYMMNELLKYYPFIEKEKIRIVGTPQFESHFDKSLFESRVDFFKKHKLDLHKKYICFSGDDITTSPYDQFYLEDTAQAIKNLNKKGYNLGIIFRRCPVDFSDRYDNVLKEYKNIIVPLNPDWEKYGDAWNTIMPTPNDFNLLVNTVFHTEAVINIGSSMVFDYACHNKPCMFINYNNTMVDKKKWDINKIYEFIHFESMPTKEVVVWLNNKEEIASKIEKTLNNSERTVKYAQEWFKIINIENPKQASENIWKAINQIIN